MMKVPDEGGPRNAVHVILTRHAVERFQSRHASHLSEKEARNLLARLTPHAVKLEEKSLLGQDQWLVDEPGTPRFIFLTKNDPKVGVVCVTVVTERMQAPTNEEVEEYTAAALRIAPKPEEPAPVAAKPTTAWGERLARIAAHEKAQKDAKEQRKKARALAVIAKEARDKEESAARKAENVAKDAEAKAKVKRAPDPNRYVPVAHAERLREHANRCESESTTARHVARLALRALRPLRDTDLGAALAWQAIEAFCPSLVGDQFIDYEKPAKSDPTP